MARLLKLLRTQTIFFFLIIVIFQIFEIGITL